MVAEARTCITVPLFILGMHFSPQKFKPNPKFFGGKNKKTKKISIHADSRTHTL